MLSETIMLDISCELSALNLHEIPSLVFSEIYF